MMELLAGVFVLFLLVFSLIQFALLWAGQGAVETAAHFASRKFALAARTDFRKAKEAALVEAATLCRHRPGGTWGTASLTSLDFSRGGNDSSATLALPGDAYRIRLTHGIELVVPWINKVLFDLAPAQKTKIGDKYYLFLQATRWVTVE